MQKNIKEMSVVELKASAYDLLAQIEQAQSGLRVINQELIEKSKEIKEEK